MDTIKPTPTIGRTLFAILLFLIWLGSGSGPALAQHEDDPEWARLRAEITRLEKELSKQTTREEETLGHLDTIDKKISTTKNLIEKIKSEHATQNQKVELLNRQAAEADAQLQRLQEIFAKRVVSLYKYGRLSTIELLLSSSSLNQVAIWSEYQRRLAANDERNRRNISAHKEEVIATRQKLETATRRQATLLAEKTKEEKDLAGDREARKKVLQKIRGDKRIYQEQIADYKKSIREIESLISASEAKQSQKPAGDSGDDFFIAGSFASSAGTLPWPVDGKIIRHYGPYQHPVLKTITDNLGIDIQVSPGIEVHAVAAGRITAITWQRGRGNLVIVNHGDGYYTVYTHLDEILVELQEDVVAGQVIGRVGETGSLGEPVLHFQIWNKFQHLNPEDWLR